MQSFDTKDSNVLESFDRKFECFDTKDSEVEQSDNDFVESFESKDSKLDQSNDEVDQNFDGKFESFESKDTKVDGRSKPRTRKQIAAYKRNFGAGKVIERKIYELDRRVQHLQRLLLNIQSNQL